MLTLRTTHEEKRFVLDVKVIFILPSFYVKSISSLYTVEKSRRYPGFYNKVRTARDFKRLVFFQNFGKSPQKLCGSHIYVGQIIAVGPVRVY